ncbi:MAG: NAD(+)/NADH kinase, partial [Clostridia bacterium]|nr:NAD(+)/NADH kinase [Clostridia bacterium]
MSVRCVGIQWNPSKATGLEVARKLVSALLNKGVLVCASPELFDALGIPDIQAGGFENCQLLIILGGDGTILSGLDSAIPFDLPILGVNLGRLGFLSEIEINELDETMINRLLDGDYTVDTRTTLMVQGYDHLKYFALNDIIIARSTPFVRILSLEYEANGTLV